MSILLSLAAGEGCTGPNPAYRPSASGSSTSGFSPGISSFIASSDAETPAETTGDTASGDDGTTGITPPPGPYRATAPHDEPDSPPLAMCSPTAKHWNFDPATNPERDENWDTVDDWVMQDGRGFPRERSDEYGWQVLPGDALDTHPAHDFGGLTIVDVQFQATEPGPAAAGIELGAGRVEAPTVAFAVERDAAGRCMRAPTGRSSP